MIHKDFVVDDPHLDRLLDDIVRMSAQVDALQYIAKGPQLVAPVNPAPNMLVWADGIKWNPGEGGGIYRRLSDNTWSLEIPIPQATGEVIGTTITLGTSGTWIAVTGLSVTITDPGIYFIRAQVRPYMSLGGTDTYEYIVARFYDVTANAPIVNSEVMGLLIDTGDPYAIAPGQLTAPLENRIVITTVPKTIRVEAARWYNGNGGSLGQIYSDVNGRSRMSYQRVTL